MRHTRYVRAACCLKVLAAILAAGNALYGSPVTVSGGFTSYNGYVGCNVGANVVTDFLNGIIPTPTTGCDATSSAPYSTTFGSPQSSVSFYGVFDGFQLPQNLIQFAPADPQEVPGLSAEFLLGYFTFTNGGWFGTTADFGLSLTTASPDALLNGSVFTGNVHLTITPNDFDLNTPQQNADCLSFTGYSSMGGLCAFEPEDSPSGNNSVTVPIYGMIDGLVPTRFGDPTDGGFVSASVPEPVSIFLAGMGLAALAIIRRRKSSVRG